MVTTVNTIPDDGYLDEVAIDLAVRGIRKVRLTAAEQREVVRRLLLDPTMLPLGIIADRARMQSTKARQIAAELGWEGVKQGLSTEVVVMVPANRPKSSHSYGGALQDPRMHLAPHGQRARR